MKQIIALFLIAVTFSVCGQNTNDLKKSISKQKTSNNKTTIMSTKNNETATIVKNLIAAMAAKDVIAIRAAFSKEASQAYGDGAAKSGTAFFKWLESDIIGREGYVENAQFTVNENQMVVTGQYSSIGYTNKANFLFTVTEGKITRWQMRY